MFIWKTWVSRVRYLIAQKGKLLEVCILLLAPFRACPLCRHWFLAALSLVLLMLLGSRVAAGSPKHGCSRYGWVGLLESSSLPRAWLNTGFITLSFFTWWYSRKQQISVGKIGQCPRKVTSPTSQFWGAQAAAGLPLVYIESNWPLMCFAMYFPLGYPLTCLFWFLAVGFFWSFFCPYSEHFLSVQFMLHISHAVFGGFVICIFSLKGLSLWRDYTGRCLV